MGPESGRMEARLLIISFPESDQGDSREESQGVWQKQA